MNDWKYTLDLSDVWGKGWTDHNVHELSTIIADRLVALCGEDFQDDWGFEDIIEGFRQVPTYEIWFRYAEESDNDLYQYPPEEQFDSFWEEFKSWAYKERVWVKR